MRPCFRPKRVLLGALVVLLDREHAVEVAVAEHVLALLLPCHEDERGTQGNDPKSDGGLEPQQPEARGGRVGLAEAPAATAPTPLCDSQQDGGADREGQPVLPAPGSEASGGATPGIGVQPG